MPYFAPERPRRPYHCQGCGGWFIFTGYSCAVAHQPGTCCHYGETPTDEHGTEITRPGYRWQFGRWEPVTPTTNKEE